LPYANATDATVSTDSIRESRSPTFDDQYQIGTYSDETWRDTSLQGPFDNLDSSGLDNPNPSDQDYSSPVEAVMGVDRRAVWPDGVFAYCYPFEKEEILERCAFAGTNLSAVGVYVPMLMETGSEHPAEWYEEIKKMKQQTNLTVIGVAYDIPRWERIEEVWDKYPDLYDGIMLEWIASGSCITEVETPPQASLEKFTRKFSKIRYFFRQQDPEVCQSRDYDFVGKTGGNDAFPFHDFILPIFACMDGYEGECYKAFSQAKYRKIHCDSESQRYAFNPYEDAGSRMYNLLNDTCNGLPAHDLYGSL